MLEKEISLDLRPVNNCIDLLLAFISRSTHGKILFKVKSYLMADLKKGDTYSFLFAVCFFLFFLLILNT